MTVVLFRSKRRAQKQEANAENLSGRLVTLREPDSAASEAFRRVRTNLFYALVDDPPKTIVVTSAHHREGKSTVCANLGVVLAQAEKNTLVVDCDLRKPVLHKMFGGRNTWGIVNVLAGELSLQDAWWEPLAGLKVVSSGPIPLNPAELLTSRRFAEFLHQSHEEFDYVVLDAPPTLAVADATIIAAQGDGVLFVLDAQNTPKRTVRHGIRSLEAVGAKVLGTVMNNIEGSPSALYKGYPY
jgi:capsular exopolysaccharide synthesis family protein